MTELIFQSCDLPSCLALRKLCHILRISKLEIYTHINLRIPLCIGFRSLGASGMKRIQRILPHSFQSNSVLQIASEFSSRVQFTGSVCAICTTLRWSLDAQTRRGKTLRVIDDVIKSWMPRELTNLICDYVVCPNMEFDAMILETKDMKQSSHAAHPVVFELDRQRAEMDCHADRKQWLPQEWRHHIAHEQGHLWDVYDHPLLADIVPEHDFVSDGFDRQMFGCQ